MGPRRRLLGSTAPLAPTPNNETTTGYGSGTSTVLVTYTYDAFGVRIERQSYQSAPKVGPGEDPIPPQQTITYYAVDGWDPSTPAGAGAGGFSTWADLTNPGTLQTRYVSGPNVNSVVGRQSSTGAVAWYLSDAEGSDTQVIDNAGHVLGRVTYNPFGAVTSGILYDASGYTGQRQDVLTGLVSMANGQQEYNPVTARFNQPNPQGVSTIAPNLYTFAQNQPTSKADVSAGTSNTGWDEVMKPTGHDTVKEFVEDRFRVGRMLARDLGLLEGVDTTPAQNTVSDVAAGLWDRAWGLTGGQIEAFAPRDRETGAIRWGQYFLMTNPLTLPLGIGGFLLDSSATTKFSRQVEENYAGYRKLGWSPLKSAGHTFLTMAPVIGSGARLAELLSGQSVQGADYGHQLTTAEKILRGVDIGIDLLPWLKAIRGRTAGAAAGRGAAADAAAVTAEAGSAAQPGWVASTFPRVNGAARWLIHDALPQVPGLGRLHDAIANFANRLGFKVCFIACTPIQWEHGAKPIEEFKSYEQYGDACDRIVSRSEHEPDGALRLRRVLRTFVRTGLVLNLRLSGGKIIGTTAEHPFFVQDGGWTAAQELKPGDQVRLMEPGWVTVEGVEDTGRVETVYNLEVEDDHTYFVGCDEWGFSVWAHNANCTITRAENGGLILSRTNGTQLMRGTMQDILDYVKEHNTNAANAGDQLTLRGRHHTSPLAADEIEHRNALDYSHRDLGEGVHIEFEPFGDPKTAKVEFSARRQGAQVDFDILPGDEVVRTRVTNYSDRETGLVHKAVNEKVDTLGSEVYKSMPLEGRNPTFSTTPPPLPWYKQVWKAATSWWRK